MPPTREQDRPVAKKIFVGRKEEQRLFDDAALNIAPDRVKLLVFYGPGGEGKSRLCTELLNKMKRTPERYGFLRPAHIDLTNRRGIDPDMLLVWVRNAFAAAGVFTRCFDLAFAVHWKNSRGDEPMPKLDHGWIGRHLDEVSGTTIDLVTVAKNLGSESLSSIPIFGTLVKTLGGFGIKKGYEQYLFMTRESLQRLLDPYGAWRPQFEISMLLPEMLAEDLNFHIATNPRERLVLLIDEYEAVFPEGGTGRIVGPNPADERIRAIATHTGGLLIAFFLREKLPWESDPDWRGDLQDSQHLLGGLLDKYADEFLRAIPIDNASLREAMIEGARETPAKDALIYPLMLDLQVEHWRSRVARHESLVPEVFRVDADDFVGRRKFMVARLLRDYGDPNLQATIRRLSCARRFDRAAFRYMVEKFHTGLEFDAFESIADLSIATRGSDGYVGLHGVIAEAIRAQLDAETRSETREGLLEHFLGRAQVVSSRDVTDAALTALLEAAYLRRGLAIEDYVGWLAAATEPFRLAARYADMARLWRDALVAVETSLGPEHLDTASSLNNIASLLQDQGDLAGARPLYERALAIFEKALGPEHSDTASSLNNLASLLQAKGDLADARPLFERALAIFEKALGPGHPQTATSLSNLGFLLQAQGDLAGARPLYERALAIFEKARGPEHPDTATSVNNLANLLQAQGDLGGARPLHERALAIREKARGPEHPDTASSLNNLASLLQEQGDLGGARPLFERALAIFEKALGSGHPQTARSLDNLACLLRAQGDLAGARLLHERALAIKEKALGPEHPQTAMSLNNLGFLLQAQGDLAGARPLFERALAIREKALGPEHPDTATSLNNLGLLLKTQGDLGGARPLYERALAIFEKALGSGHPQTATSLDNLGFLLQAQGDLAGARPLHERALAIFEKALGSGHPDTATSLNNLGLLLKTQGDLGGARALFERALAICEKALGPEHPATAVSLDNLGFLLQAQGDLAGARPLCERALAIFEKALGSGHPDTAIARGNLANLSNL